MADKRRYRVSELARLCDVNPRTVDYYTVSGLLTPVARSGGGHRYYGEEAARRLRAIKALQAQGLPLEAIKGRLAAPTGEADLLPRIEFLRAELRRLEGEVAELAPHLAARAGEDSRLRGALQASITGAAAYALTLAQELMELLNRGGLGPF
jgi:MerR family transcriptional regulator, copper efflux regulator